MTEQLDDADPATDALPVLEPSVPEALAIEAAPDAAAAAPAPEGATAAPSPEAAPPPVNGADASLLALIDRLSTLLDRSELTELEVQVGSTGLVLRKPQAIAPQVVAGGAGGAAPTDGAATGASAATPTAATEGPPARPAVMAPLSGIWYGSPAPGTAPYVNVGGEVAVGQVIGLIEAMKLFNEIKSDKAGRVVKINAENGKLVRAKQPLIEVEPL
jgi:acetyl-CoA carboxylase biotin carboxyl carrier protein